MLPWNGGDCASGLPLVAVRVVQAERREVDRLAVLVDSVGVLDQLAVVPRGRRR